ncbi:hypothetical protein [Streptomyces sp. NPDC001635]
MTHKEYREILARRRGGQAAQPAAAALPQKKARRKPPAHPGPPSVPEPLDLEPMIAGLSRVGYVRPLLMPYVEEMLTSNQRLHHMAKHRIRKRLREDAAGLAMALRLPHMERAAFFYALHPRSIERNRDPGNWADTMKAYVDGLVTDGKVLPDDNHKHLMGPIPWMGAPVPTGYARMTIVIAELLEPLTSGNAETVTGTPTSTYRT